MIIIGPEDLLNFIDNLKSSPALAVDTETTGLYPWKRDRLFSIQFSDATEDYYLNFQEYDTEEKILKFSNIKLLQPLFDNKTIFMQNAKFDMSFLWKEGVRFDQTDMHDTEVCGRIIRNDHLKYSLDEQSKREFGTAKDEAVMEWLKKNKKFTTVIIPGKDTPYKNFHFDKVPFEIISKYGCKDTRLTYDLGIKQIKQLEMISSEAGPGQKSIMNVWEMEKKLIHTCFEMERVGVQIDRKYCDEAIEFETKRIQNAEESFTSITGQEITDSGLFLGPIFKDLGFHPGLTATGEFEVTDAFLEKVTHPLGKIVQEYRDARKRANTYFKSYVYHADHNGVIHPNMRQSGTATGRFSYSDPNLQNIPSGSPEEEDKDSSPYPVRRSFIPREGYFLLSIDYKQMEFRMMLDEAAQHDLINKIKAGHDPHDATAELTGLTRKAAKTLNFGLLYGMGVAKLAGALKVSEEDAKAFKKKYFSALPMVENFIIQCSGAVKTRSRRDPGNGWIKTWDGRRGYFNDEKWAYKAANFKIQGGCAGVVKIAMNNLHEYLKDKNSRMCVQIHDELLFEISFEEQDIVKNILKIMETAYPSRFIPLTCSTSYSLKSFYDMVEEGSKIIEDGQAKREHIQRKDTASVETLAKHLVS
jgi:DNA polymerase-1